MPPKMRMTLVAVGGLIVLAGALAGWLMLRSHGPRLDRSPQESRRVHHPAGFSIIPPENTHAYTRSVPTVQGTQHAIDVYVDGESRLVPVIQVRMLPAPPNMSVMPKLRPKITFQEQEAYVSNVIFEGYDAWNVLFQRGDAWYELSLHLPHDPRRDDSDWPPTPWRPFLTSFRVDTPSTAPATTMSGDQ